MLSMKVDVIYSLECGSPIILEVIDRYNIEFSNKKLKEWQQYYKNVHMVCGVDFIKESY